MAGARRMAVMVAGLLAAGALRLPLEAKWSAEWRQAGLLRAELAEGTGAKLGQTLFAVSLGGLRTLVATFLNLRVMKYYELRDWDRIHETYELMTALAPRTEEYWFAGAHHQAMNAASYYRHDDFLEMPEPRRKALWRASVLRGREFAERGTRHLPESADLQRFLGLLLTDRHRLAAFDDPDATFEAAARAFGAAADLPDALPFLRRQQASALARVPMRRAEALAMTRELYADRSNHSRLLRQVYFALRCWEAPGPDRPLALALEMFGDERTAHRELANYWSRADEQFPMDGVALALLQLEARLGLPDERSALRARPSSGDDGDDPPGE